jgi:hypothetical protein
MLALHVLLREFPRDHRLRQWKHVRIEHREVEMPDHDRQRREQGLGQVDYCNELKGTERVAAEKRYLEAGAPDRSRSCPPQQREVLHFLDVVGRPCRCAGRPGAEFRRWSARSARCAVVETAPPPATRPTRRQDRVEPGRCRAPATRTPAAEILALCFVTHRSSSNRFGAPGAGALPAHADLPGKQKATTPPQAGQFWPRKLKKA